MENYKTVFVGIEYAIVAHTWNISTVSQKEKDGITWSMVIDKQEIPLKDKGVSIKYKFKDSERGKRILFKPFFKSPRSSAAVPVYVSYSKVSPLWLDMKGNRIMEAPYGRKVQFELLFQDSLIRNVINITVTLENKDKSFSEEVFTTRATGCAVVKGRASIIIDVKNEWRDMGPKEFLYDLYLSVKVSGIYLMTNDLICWYRDGIYKEKLLIKDFFVDEEGWLINPRVEKVEEEKIYRFPKVREFENKDNVNAVVLHRTDGYTGTSALSMAINHKQGGHFTVEGGIASKYNISPRLSGLDGAIYQFGSLKKEVVHVGQIRPRPKDPDVAKKQDWKKGDSHHFTEIKKEYPDRFPYNADSIGIEVVGKCLESREKGWEADWEKLTQEQIVNVAWLTNGLLEYFNLNKNKDLYPHEYIRSKTWDEGGVVLRAIESYLK